MLNPDSFWEIEQSEITKSIGTKNYVYGLGISTIVNLDEV